MRSDDKRYKVFVRGYFIVHAPSPEEAVARVRKLAIEPDFINKPETTGEVEEA